MANKKNRNRSKKNGNYNPDKSKRDSRVSGDVKVESSNDPQWYAMNPVLLNNAADLPYPYANGSKYDLGIDGLGENSVPGIMSLKLMPSFGGFNDGISPLNVAANQVYSYVRHMNSGSANYDAPDLLIYILAMDSCYSYLAWLMRLYGVLMDYTPFNYYLPKSLVTAMGVDFDDIVQHIPDLRYFINSYSLKCSTLKVPDTMSYLKRHFWMYSNIYSDEEGQKGQLYMYNPDGFYKYHETVGEDPGLIGTLEYVKLSAGSQTVDFDRLVQFGSDLLEVNRMSEDHNIMSGDIMKAYQGNVFTIPTIPDNYQIVPVYDEEVLNQIHNCTAIGGPFDFTNDGVYTDPETNYLVNPIWTTSHNRVYTDLLTASRFCNMHKMDVTPSDTMVATRLMTILKQHPTEDKLLVSNCGSEIVTDAHIYSNFFNEDGTWQLKITECPFCTLYIDDIEVFGYVLNDLAIVSKFRNHPACFVAPAQAETTVYNFFMDLYNYTVVDYKELAKMHETALLSMLGIN